MRKRQGQLSLTDYAFSPIPEFVPADDELPEYPEPLEAPAEIDVYCLECGFEFSEESPDECPNCGGSDLEVA